MDRTIRVFVSSTFRDMQAERDYLVKFTFPQLRKLCESRGVTWGEVDLRWGITDEEKAEGKVLPLCLEEIHRCRPYFIGLLGERYGWIPDAIPPEVLEREAWLREHVDERKSVTELEILHGVLNNPEMANHAFFYFRDPNYVAQLPTEQREDFTSEDTESAERLKELKARIRHNHFPVRENYADPKALGELVLKDFTGLIDLLFPEGEKLDPLDREAADHEAFAQSRARVYIGRQEYFDRLDEHVQSDGPPLVVLGESGSGKSALLGNWAIGYRAKHPDAFVIQHFVGATPYSADWAAMLRRIMGEFKRRFDIQQDIPDKPDELRSAFANWLHMAAAKGKAVIVLDALNQLEDRDGAPDLVWLPPEIPGNIRLILSTLPGRALDDVNKRGWPTLQIKPLEPEERKRLIAEYLAQYTKALSPARIEHIVSADQTANPLFLRAVLDELRVFGVHEQLDDRVEHYLSAATIAELYEKILTRYEEDYERERAGLVRDTMSLLWAARRGLSEAELMDLLGTEQGPLPRAHWSPVYLAAEQSLVSRSGLIGFGHNYLRQAVRDKYLPVEQDQQAAHLRLVDYFETQDLGARKIDELPWQLAEARWWQRLSDLLTDRQFFIAAWNANQFEVKRYWATIERESSLRIVDAHALVISTLATDVDHMWVLGKLLAETGHPNEAFSIFGFLLHFFRQTHDRANLQECLSNQANIFYARGELDESMRLHKEQQRICRELGDMNGLSTSLDNQAVILKVRGQLDESMRLLKEAARITREVGNRYGLGNALLGQANIFYARGELDEAMKLHTEVERISLEMGNKNALSVTLGSQGLIHQDRGELDEAMRLFKKQECLCTDLGDKDGLSGCLGNQANLFCARHELSEAMRLLKEQERLSRELGNISGLAITLHNQANIFYLSGAVDKAVRLLKEAERIFRQLRNKEGLAKSLLNQAGLIAIEQPHEALPLAEEAYQLATQHGFVALEHQIEPILNSIRSRLH